jgi:hypothetical protein
MELSDADVGIGAPPTTGGAPPTATSSGELSDADVGIGTTPQTLAPGQSSATTPAAPESAAYQEGVDRANNSDDLPSAIGMGIASGAFGNVTDHALAAGAGAISWAKGEGFSKAYHDELDRGRGFNDTLAAKYPKGTLGGEVVGSLLPGVAASKFIKAGTVGGRMGQAALAGAGVGAYEGAVGTEGGVEDRAKAAAQGAGAGLAFGALGEGVAGAVEKGVGAVGSHLLGASSETAPGVSPAARAAAAGEFFDKPLTRGQATGDLAQQAWEESARHGALGEAAQKTLTEGSIGPQDIEAAKSRVFPTTDPGQAGTMLGQGMRSFRDELKQRAGDFYDSAERKDAWIAADHVHNLAGYVANQLQNDGIALDSYGNYPAARNAMSLMGRLAGFEGAPANQTVVAQSLAGLEQARKGLLKITAPIGSEDGRALKSIRNAYDSWISDAIDQHLFSGDPTAIDDLKSARGLWSAYKGFDNPGKGDPVAPIVRKIMSGRYSGDEIANYITGTMNAGKAGNAARLLDHLSQFKGPNSPEAQQMRDMIWSKVVNPARGTGPQALSSSIDNFVTGQGRAVASKLFQPDELAKIQRFNGVLKNLVPDKLSTNPSKSGFTAARLARTAVGSLPFILGGEEFWRTGDWVEALRGGLEAGAFLGIGAHGGSKLLDRNAWKANAALRSVPRQPRQIPRALTAGIAGGAAQGFAEGGGVEDQDPDVFDRTKVGSGIPLYYDASVLDVDPRELIRAHQATDPDMAEYKKVPGIQKHVDKGGKLGMPEVGALYGQLRFTNGRNRSMWAAQQGLRSIPIAVDKGNEADVLGLLKQHSTPKPPGTIQQKLLTGQDTPTQEAQGEMAAGGQVQYSDDDERDSADEQAQLQRAAAGKSYLAQPSRTSTDAGAVFRRRGGKTLTFQEGGLAEDDGDEPAASTPPAVSPTPLTGASTPAAPPKTRPVISTRLPTAKKATESGHDLVIDGDAATRDPSMAKTNTNLMRGYVNLTPEEAGGSDEEVRNHFTNHVKDNLLWLHDQVPPEVRERSAKWYDGANRLVKSRAKITGKPEGSVSGVYAALSPQKDWYQNVSLGDRVMDIHMNQQDTRWSPEMDEKVSQIFGKPQYKAMLDGIRGKKLSEMTEPAEKAMWIRAYDEAHHAGNYPKVSPEGRLLDDVKTKAGNPAKVAWQSTNEVAKAIKAFESDGTADALSPLMGERHKVRNFYNNMLDPNNPRGDVTIDTHAVAAGLLRPLSGQSTEVAHNFKNSVPPGEKAAAGSTQTGAQGLYGHYADAYRQAASERGILPRQMQSITWEAIRSMFPAEWKNATNAQAVDHLWKMRQQGALTLDQVRDGIKKLTGGVKSPDWYEQR